MWIIFAIVVIVVFIIGKYLIALKDQSTEIRKEGGMRNKYAILIEHLVDADPRVKIFHESSNSITFGIHSVGTIASCSTFFVITQAFDTINIQWKVDSSIDGKHKLEWNFPIHTDQYKMAEKIHYDIARNIQISNKHK